MGGSTLSRPMDDTVEVDVNLDRESKRERSTKIVKIENGDCLKFTVRLLSLFHFYFYFHLFIFG